jgi:hypothetical protein
MKKILLSLKHNINQLQRTYPKNKIVNKQTPIKPGRTTRAGSVQLTILVFARGKRNQTTRPGKIYQRNARHLSTLPSPLTCTIQKQAGSISCGIGVLAFVQGHDLQGLAANEVGPGADLGGDTLSTGHLLVHALSEELGSLRGV